MENGAEREREQTITQTCGEMEMPDSGPFWHERTHALVRKMSGVGYSMIHYLCEDPSQNVPGTKYELE